jgi:hypothetical protein
MSKTLVYGLAVVGLFAGALSFLTRISRASDRRLRQSSPCEPHGFLIAGCFGES